MNRTKKIKKILFWIVTFSVLVAILLPYILMIGDPIRRSEYSAKTYVLEITPIGMDVEEAIEIINNHRDWNARISYEQGFVHPRPHTLEPMPEVWPFVVGEQSIRVDFDYWHTGYPIIGVFLGNLVTIFWGFDEDGILIDVYVWKRIFL